MRLRWLVVGMVVLVVGAVVGVLVFANRLINANRDRILAAAQAAIGGTVRVGDIGARFFGRPGVRLSDLSIDENPAFGDQPFVQARSATIVLKLRPLLERRIEIARIVLERPTVRVIRAANGTFNYDTLGPRDAAPAPAAAPPAAPAGQPSGSPPAGALTWLVAVFDMEDGEVTFVDEMAKPPKTISVKKISLEASDIALDKAMHFDLRAAYDAPDENIELSGDVGPVGGATEIPFDLAGSIGPLPNVLPSKLDDLAVKGRLQPQAPQRLSVDSFGLSGFGGKVSGKADAALVQGGAFSLQADAEKVGVGQVLPIAAPEMQGQIDGTATANLDIKGVLDQPEILRRSLRGALSVDIKNGVLHGFNLAGEVVNRLTNMPGLSRLISRGVKPKYAEVINRPDTKFETMKLRLGLVPGGAEVENMTLDGEDFGATASGSLTLPNIADLSGNLLLSRRFSDDIASDVKEARLLYNENDQIALPFFYRGVIGQAKPQANVQKLTESVLKGRGQDLLDAVMQGGEKGEDAVDTLKRGLKGLFGR